MSDAISLADDVAQVIHKRTEEGNAMSDIGTAPYTMDARLCDDAGMISDEPVAAGNPGTRFDPDLTYRRLLNNLRNHTGLPPYTGPAVGCTGSAHLAGEHIRCTNPRHETSPVPASALDPARCNYMYGTSPGPANVCDKFKGHYEPHHDSRTQVSWSNNLTFVLKTTTTAAVDG